MDTWFFLSIDGFNNNNFTERRKERKDEKKSRNFFAPFAPLR
jgi:hypothetical protein